MIIRTLISFIALAMGAQLLFAQLPEKWTDYDEIWLPEKAIEDILTNHTTANYPKFSSPVQVIVLFKNEIYVRSFRGKYAKPKIKKRGKKKELINPIVLNLKYFWEGQFDNTRFFLSDEDPDRMLLELYDKGRIDSVYFIKSLGPYAFEEPYTAYNRVLLSGDYRTPVDGIDTDVNLGLDWQIKGHPKWVNYSIKRRIYFPPKESKIYYILVDFTLKDTDVPLELAFLYDDNAKVWEGYEYKINEDRSFSRSEMPVVRLEKQALNSNKTAIH